MADSSTLVQAPDGPRIMFVGVGTFVMIIVVIVAAIIIVSGRGLPQPIVAYAGAAALVAVSFLFLLFAPREPAFTTPDEQQRLTSDYFAGIILITILALLSVLGSLAGVVVYGCADPVEAMIIDDEMSAYG